MYIIKRNDGMFVANVTRSGGASYTRKLEYARKFSTREAAERDRCPGNESIYELERELDAFRR